MKQRLVLVVVLLSVLLAPTAGAQISSDESLEIKLFISDEIASLHPDTCVLDDFGQPGRLHVKSWDGEHEFKFDLPSGLRATMTTDSGDEYDGCFYVFEIEIPESRGYTFSILDYELDRVNYRILLNLTDGAHLYYYAETPQSASDPQSSGPSPAKSPVEPIAYAPGTIRVIQKFLVDTGAREGEPVILVITSFEFPSTGSADVAFQEMCDDVAAWYIETGGSAYWREVTSGADETCGVIGDTESTTTVVVRYGEHVVSYTTGGLNFDAIAWIENFFIESPYDPEVAVPSANDLPGDWDVMQESSGDVTDIAQTPRLDRP